MTILPSCAYARLDAKAVRETIAAMPTIMPRLWKNRSSTTTTKIMPFPIKNVGAVPAVDDVKDALLELGWNRTVLGTSALGRDLVVYDLVVATTPQRKRNDADVSKGVDRHTTVLFLSLTHGNEPMGLVSLLAAASSLSGFSAAKRNSRYNDSDVESNRTVSTTRIVLFPFVNIDAYENNMRNQQERRGNFGTCNQSCVRQGVDLNRNFQNDWFDQQYSSKSFNYGGSRQSFSEPESQTVRRIVLAYNVTHAMSFHSMGYVGRPRLLIHPFTSHRPWKDMPPERAHTYRSWSATLNDKHSYVTGTAMESIGYTALGSSIDWMDSLGIYAFVLEAVPPCTKRFCPHSKRKVRIEALLNARTAIRFVELAAAPNFEYKEKLGSDLPFARLPPTNQLCVVATLLLAAIFMVKCRLCGLKRVVKEWTKRKQSRRSFDGN